MDKTLNQLRERVAASAANPSFVHREWFVEWHLKIMERIALELCGRYPEADQNLVLALVWLHDYAKILDKSREHDEEMMGETTALLAELGFPEDFRERFASSLALFEKKMEVDLSQAPIEVQIASSSDAASHLVGPFFSIYWRENPNESTGVLTESNRQKLLKDWERKITLPEVREVFRRRHEHMMEMAGELPENFLGE